ncbi:MAG: AAA family ATPase [Gammaproteobacteria bacterium]|nr:AAA family ATPase [Gammaproteobacteria bacterium]MCW8910489.1 AAA family ATPase [Gammaproteobacteria bacterium]MCW9004689.1 AAA family ATPase [Gammaproteobacteria bacterium]MCW9056787.1 AAA family ATPase [Gammaproteobacteria bacterium]
MYLEHFGLKRQPFKITPDTSLFYKGSKRGAALEALKYSVISGEGIIKVVGEVGSGKTMLCRMLEVELPDNIEVVYIANPSLSPENILHVIAFELHLAINNQSDKLEVMQKLQQYLLDKHSKGKQVVVFVEEAQSMPVETLEEIRLLSNLETSHHKLLQMILFGQPELDEKLRDTSIRQLRERITHSFYLDPFPTTDIYEYLNFRMRAVGYRGPDIFTKKIANNIEKKSKGLTRRINILADKALLAVYSEGGHGISRKHISIAAKDSEFDQSKNHKPAIVAVIVVAVIAASFWLGTLIPSGETKIVEQLISKQPDIQQPVLTEVVNEFKAESVIRDVPESLLERRIQSTEEWLGTAGKDDFTIQLVLMDAEFDEKVVKFLEESKDPLNIEKVFVYQAYIRGKKMYSVLYNSYNDWQQANAQLRALPRNLKANGPYLRTVKGIRADIRKSQQFIRAGTNNTGVLN